ncbi:MAG: hypothetical protein ACRDN0_09875, partial [Trebonia sp.]
MGRPSQRHLATKLILIAAIIIAGASALVVHGAAQPSSSGTKPTAPGTLPFSQEGMYASYSLWWDTQH